MSDLDTERLKRLDGSLLLVFVELMRHGRATAVAKRLGLSQSAISHALARLRDLFADPLFVRRPNGLQPTRHALELLPRVEAVLQLAHDTLALGERFDPSTSRRHFRIGAPDYVCALLANGLLRAFEREAPTASFSFRLMLGREAIDGLRRDEIDAAIGRLPRPLAGYRSEVLFEEEYCVIARREHPRLSGALDLAGYRELGHVLVSVSGDLVGFHDPWLQRAGVTRRIVASVPRFSVAFSVVADSDAIATVPRRLAARQAAQFGLQLLDVPFAVERFAIEAQSRASDDPALVWLLGQLRTSV